MSYSVAHDFRRGTHSSDDLQDLADGLAALTGAGGTRAPVFNVKQVYGATGDGTTDDAAAIRAAVTAALAATGGGVVYLPPGTYRIASALTIDGGISNAASSSLAQLATLPPTIAFVCDGAIKADAGIVTALTVKQAINPFIQARFLGGGNTTDVAVLVQAIYGLDLDIYAQGFAGIVCKADGTTAANNLVSGRVRSLRAENCGQGINWKSINAFGNFDFVETVNNQVAGDIFQLCADIDISFWNAYYGTGITNGITFDGCNNFNHVVIEAGDRPTNAVVRVCADSGGTNFGRMIARVSQYTLAAPTAGIELDEVSSGDFDLITYGQGGVSGTNWANTGVRVRGGGVSDTVRIRHHSQTRETNSLKVEAHSTSTPNLRVEADYRFTNGSAVVADVGVTGGLLVFTGRMAQLNQSATAATPAVADASAAVLDVSGLLVPSPPNGGIFTKTDKTKVRTTRDREQYARTVQGIISECGPAPLYVTPTALVSQTVYGELIGLKAGDLVTGILLRNQVAAAGTAPTTVRAGLADSTGKILVLSGNLNNSTNWPAGAMPLAFTSPYSVIDDGAYFACVVVNGTWGTTQPTPIRVGGSATALAAFGSAAPSGFTWTGQTDLPSINSSVTLSAQPGLTFYMAAY